MKPSRISRIGLCIVFVFMGSALGCLVQPAATQSGSSSGDMDAERVCDWDMPGVDFPVCAEENISVWTGMVDGMPYSRENDDHITGMSNIDGYPPYRIGMNLDYPGIMAIYWNDSALAGQWHNITNGTIRLPEDNKERNILPGSKLIERCYEYYFRYIFVVDGGNLTGCSH